MSSPKLLTSASAAMALLAAASSVRAGTIYGFNDATLNGFALSYDGSDNADASLKLSTGTGVTEGTGALDLHSGSGAGYTQTDFRTAMVPTDLTTASSFTVTAETYYADANYITVAPVLFIDGSFSNVAAGAPAGIFDRVTTASQTLQPAAAMPGATPPNTLTFSLLFKDYYATAHAASVPNGTAATAADGHSTTAVYTPDQILTAFLAANPGASATVDGFALETTTSGTAAGVDVYFDNLSVAGATPEPASMGVIAVGGLALLRRRTR